MNFNIILGEALKRVKLNKIAYRNNIMVKSVNNSIKRNYINNNIEARELLNKRNKKPLGKCYTKNILKEPIYDLKIIVPAYNVAHYIDECLKSILIQETRYKIKIVIINDGSTDGTEEILHNYNKYKNIEIINQKNKGLSGARNTALNNLDSKYIMFVDSDDKLEKNSIELLMECALKNDSDIVEGSYFKFDNKNNILYKDIHEYKINLPAFNNIRSFAWGKVIKSSLFENICFPEGFWYEDTVFMYLIFPNCKKASTISECVYLYRHNVKGITVSSRKNDKCIDTYWILESMIEEMEMLNI